MSYVVDVRDLNDVSQGLWSDVFNNHFACHCLIMSNQWTHCSIQVSAMSSVQQLSWGTCPDTVWLCSFCVICLRDVLHAWAQDRRCVWTGSLSILLIRQCCTIKEKMLPCCLAVSSLSLSRLHSAPSCRSVSLLSHSNFKEKATPIPEDSRPPRCLSLTVNSLGFFFWLKP